MTYILQIWKKYGSPIRLKTRYTSIVTARKAAYEKMHGKTPIRMVDIIDDSKHRFCEYLHWGRTPKMTIGKVITDTDGNLDDSGHYVRADGTIYPTEINRWRSQFKKR